MNDVTAISSHPKFQDYAGYKLRDEWLDVVSTIPKARSSTWRTAIRIARHFNCTTGQCNPGWDTIADKAQMSIKSVERGVEDLENRGLIGVKYKGRKENCEITLMIPDPTTSCRIEQAPELLDPTASCPDRSDSKLSGVIRHTGSRTEHLLNNEENTEQSGAPAPRSVPVDSQSDVTEEANPSAPDGAGTIHERELDMPAPTISEAPGEPLNPGCPAADLETLAQELAGTPGLQVHHIRPKTEHLNRDDRTTVIARWIEITHERKAEVAA